MITDLLWRCPLCATDDALALRRRVLRRSELWCCHCGATWEVRRVVGDDYWLKVVTSPQQPGEAGADLPLARWYDRLKETLVLEPQSNPPVALADNERLYVCSQTVRLTAQVDDPLFFGNAKTETKRDPRKAERVRIGKGRLFLTNQRLIWQGADGRHADFSLEKLNSAYATFNIALILMCGMSLYSIRFTQESLLKWITYFALVAPEVKATTGHLITTSNY